MRGRGIDRAHCGTLACSHAVSSIMFMQRCTHCRRDTTQLAHGSFGLRGCSVLRWSLCDPVVPPSQMHILKLATRHEGRRLHHHAVMLSRRLYYCHQAWPFTTTASHSTQDHIGPPYHMHTYAGLRATSCHIIAALSSSCALFSVFPYTVHACGWQAHKAARGHLMPLIPSFKHQHKLFEINARKFIACRTCL